jgi:hypothetical protein
MSLRPACTAEQARPHLKKEQIEEKLRPGKLNKTESEDNGSRYTPITGHQAL